MALAIDAIDRLLPSERPPGAATGYHRWHDLLFLHWPVPEQSLRALVPPPLEIDTFCGQAYVGLVAFWMSGVKARGWPAAPWLSCFAETNVRTYVVLPGGEPGVWFMSLDAARLAPALVARRFWHLPYYWSKMSVHRAGSRIRYRSRRLLGARPARTVINVDVADARHAVAIAHDAVGEFPQGLAVPGTRTHFLVERYTLYCADRRGRLYSARVHHAPYSLQAAEVTACEQSLTTAAGVGDCGEPVHAVYSPGASVEVFSLAAVRT